MLHVAICVFSQMDVVHIDEILQTYQETYPKIKLKTEVFSSGEHLLGTIKDGHSFDLFLLNVQLPGMDGITLARRLREQGCRGGIIFFTDSREYAFDAFGVQAVDYLLKPLDAKGLFNALDRAILLHSRQGQSNYTIVKTAGAQRITDFNDIIAIEVQGHTLCYYLTSGEVLKSKVLRVSFATATADLMADKRFIKPHQSFLVNAGHITGITQRKFIMENGMEVPISRLRYSEVKNQYLGYLANRG